MSRVETGHGSAISGDSEKMCFEFEKNEAGLEKMKRYIANLEEMIENPSPYSDEEGIEGLRKFKSELREGVLELEKELGKGKE